MPGWAEYISLHTIAMTITRLAAVRRLFIRLGLVAAAILATGCATTTQAPDPLATSPRPGESNVVISITTNTAQVGAFDTLVLSRIQPAGQTITENHVLNQILPGLARDTSVFIGVLPEGEYEFSTLRHNASQQFLALGAEQRKRLGRVEVRGGQPIDLGRLIVTPVNTRVLVGRSARITSNTALLRRFAPEYARLFDGLVAPGWTLPRPDDDRTEEYALQRPVGAASPHELPDGQVVAASRLGTVLQRSSSGAWRMLSSDDLNALMYVMPVNRPDASLIAVGEFSTLLRLPPGGTKLVPIDTGDLPPGNLLFISGSDQTGWYVAQQRGVHVTLLRSDKLEAGRWQPVRQESVAASFWSGANSFWIWQTERGLAYAVSEGRIHDLDTATGTWTVRKAPSDHRLLNVAPDPGGKFGILTSPGGGFGGVFAGTWIWNNAQGAWAEIKTDFKVKVAPPRQTPGGDMLMIGGVFSSPELHASKDGGKTWQKVADFALDQSLVILPSGNMLGVAFGQHGLFRIRHSSDQGKTWQTEYSNFDRTAYETQESRKKK